MPDRVDEAKRALRAELRERRRMMSEASRRTASEGVRRELDGLVDRIQARSLSCYLSTGTEPETRGFIRAAVARGIRVLLPVTRADGLLDWAVADPDGEFADGLFGVPEPVGELLGPIAVGDVDLMIVPAAAVATDGMRLGWGRGYFDKTIGSMERRPPAFAVIYDSELLDDVPRDAHDQRVDGIVTPTRTLALAEPAR